MDANTILRMRPALTRPCRMILPSMLMSMLPPDMRHTTFLPRSLTFPDRIAAVGTAPAPSAMVLWRSMRNTRALAISSSLTVTTLSTIFPASSKLAISA